MLHDLRYALRALRKNPGFTAVAVLTLALGLGANTTVFSAIYTVILEKPPFHRPGELRVVGSTLRDESGALDTLRWWSYPAFEAFRDGETGFSELAAFTPNPQPYNMAGAEAPRQVRVEMASAGYFGVLGVTPALGRGFAPDEDLTPGTHPVAVVSHELWRSAFGGDSALVGNTITLSSVPLTVVGIMPPGFAGVSGRAEVWVPMMMAPTLVFPRRLEQTLSFWHAVVGRQGPDVPAARAEAVLAQAARRVEARIPLTEAFGPVELGFVPIPLAETRVDPMVRRALFVLFAAVACVLLIACVNVANLLLARGAGRVREIGVRVALGVSRGRLARQLVVESLLLSVAGGAAALVLATWGLSLLTALRPPALAGTADLADVRLSLPVLGFNLAIALATGLIFGLIPALAASRTDARTLLATTAGTGHRVGPRGGLVAAQLALAVVLLVGAGLLLRSLDRLSDRPLGFSPDRVLTAYVNIPRQSYTGEEAETFFLEAVARLRERSDVRRASVGNCLPVSGRCDNVRMLIQSDPLGAEQAPREVWMNMVDAEYFAALGIPVVSGRTFSSRDDSEAPRVAIVNEAAARRYFPGRDPIGERIQLTVGWGPEDDWAEVVGVVGDVKLGGLDQPMWPGVYLSYPQYSYRSNYLVVQAEGDPLSLAGTVRSVVQELDRTLPLWDVRSMGQRVAAALAQDRFSTVLLSIFGGLALALAAVGVYGVLSFSVAGRTREIGVRVAMGARDGDVVRLILRQGLLVTLVGLAIGTGLALVVTRFLGAQLHDISATDPLSFAAAVLVLVSVAALASYLPARRAARTDPMEALRHE